MEFDGVDDYIDVTDAAIFAFTVANQYAWSFWINPDDFEQWHAIWFQGNSSCAQGMYIFAQTTSDANWRPLPAGISAGMQNSGSTCITLHSTSNVRNLGQWHHVIVTYDGALTAANRFNIYINGANVTAVSEVSVVGTAFDVVTSQIRIGNEDVESCAGENFDGSIDDVRYYNRRDPGLRQKRPPAVYLQIRVLLPSKPRILDSHHPGQR